MMHHSGDEAAGASPSPTARRIIFLQIPGAADAGQVDPSSLFAIGAVRVPQFFVDVDLHSLTLLGVHPLGPGTGWGLVPTPMF
jgi:hypothetical protein